MSTFNEAIPHQSVLKNEVLEQLLTRKSGSYKIIDGTLGYGGHSENFLKANPDAEVLGIDRDEDALEFSKKRLAFATPRVVFCHGCYSQMAEFAQENDFESIDAILLDIGISSPQIDQGERGFSIRFNGPLDMRMNRQDKQTAASILNHADEEELAYIFKEYGEVRSARKLANAVIEKRKVKFFETTGEFAELCNDVCGKPRAGNLPVATLCFQALRIAVNHELDELDRVLPIAMSLLKKGGRLGVISFHSLEDRRVKQFFAREATECICPPKLPICCCGHHASLKLVSKKPITAGASETAQNPRANCAKLRVAEKL